MRPGLGKATADPDKSWKERIYDLLLGVVHALTILGISAVIIRYVPEFIYTHTSLMPPGAAGIASLWDFLVLPFSLALVFFCLWLAVRVFGGVL